ncbi:hypothetical protein BH20VER1_BH20VER1_29820 [soil metagenome]
MQIHSSVPDAVALPAAGGVCSVCGSRLSSAGACVACLLRGGLDDAQEASRFGDFEIELQENGALWELGRGAMGVTYRAVDRVLHRDVALKVIDTPAVGEHAEMIRERFLRETRAAATLRHPNIAGVFQFGTTPDRDRCYCAMELVEGETLEQRVRRDGALSVPLVLEIAEQVTRGLVAAGERGLVHRDLKPANIMLAGGADAAALHVKIIDFGLAKASSANHPMELTQGGFVGTPAFASPEQFTGGEVDSRSDVYALGVTLWFALTGRLPVGGSTIEEVRRNQQQQPLQIESLRGKGVPKCVAELLRSCLALEAAERPAPNELLQALQRCRARPAALRRRALLATAALLLCSAVAVGVLRPRDGPLPPRPPQGKSIAVLPFENLSIDPDDAFLTEGIREDLSTSIGKIKELKVIARSSVNEYRGAAGAENAREIGRKLGVSHLLTGSVRRAGDRLAVSVALIDANEERQLWSERYDRTVADTLSLQGDLAREIARALQPSLGADGHVAARKPTENPEAYLLYLRAHELEAASTDNPDQPSARQALELYERAFALDPNFALARARFSIFASAIGYSLVEPQLQAIAREQADEALRLHPDLGEAWLGKSCYSLYVDRDPDRALAEVNRAAELLPNSAEVWMTTAFIYKRQNRLRDRIAALRRAEELDPLNRTVSSLLVLTMRWVRDWPGALRAAERRSILSAARPHLASGWTVAYDEFRRSGNLEPLQRAVAHEENADQSWAPQLLPFARHELALLERDYASASRWLSEIPAETFDDSRAIWSLHQKPTRAALLAVANGSPADEVRAALDRAEADVRLVAHLPSDREGPHGPAERALILAFRGEKEEAIAELDRAIRAAAIIPDSVEMNALSSARALVYARTGEPEKAMDLIEHLLTVPCEVHGAAVYNMTLTELKWRWVWDPLRSHPRFQKLISGPEPKTIY